MAYYQLEPFGELVADMRHGEATRVLAECNRNPATRSEPYHGSDFVYWRRDSAAPLEDGDALLLEDPVAQSNLIRSAIFGKRAKP